ncbi:E3 ubiquitin-protein ligase rnf213-alpha-like isoform X2 [Mya arenaria]|uniref:E3 ubiquitin-protein ligase rnf213-alpha-like isoform X2 n=1 Tax=Mya arenaria TaxID=6604 RepID=UPI0022E4D9B6|nr:E3 ubiquitin-protein ligase rnf213-alpha-like isoform X2 [Mya arenaria]
MMKKCSNPKCGFEGEWKFCQECGGKMIDPPTKPILSSIVIICDGDDESGSPCGEELRSTQKFCTSCGKQVDIKLFEVQTPDVEKCSRCGTMFTLGIKFCPECGCKVQPMAEQATDGPPSQENQASVVDNSDAVSVATIGEGGIQNDIQHYQHAPNQIPPSQPRQAEGPDLNMEVLESATEVEHLGVESQNQNQTLHDQTGERDKQEEPDTDTPSAVDVQQREASSPEPIEKQSKASELTEEEETYTYKQVAKKSQSQEEVKLVSSETTDNNEDDAMDTSDFQGDNKLRVFNLDDGSDERKQETFMQGDPGSNINEANQTANANNNNCVATNAIQEADSKQQSFIYKENVSTKVCNEKNGNNTAESRLEKSIKAIHIAQDDTMNESSNGETFGKDLSDKDDNGSEDDSVDSDSSQSFHNDDDTESTTPVASGEKRPKKANKGGTKAKKVKKRNRKKEIFCEKHNLPFDKKEKDDTVERKTRSKTMEEKKKSGEVVDNAAENKQTVLKPDEEATAKSQQEWFVFGQHKMQTDQSSTDVESGKNVFESSEQTTPSFFQNNSISSQKTSQGGSKSVEIGKPDNKYNTRSNDASSKPPPSSTVSGTYANAASHEKMNKNDQINLASKNQQNKQQITIVFHVLVAKDCFTSENDLVILKMADKLGEWKSNERQARPVSSANRVFKDYIEYEYRMPFDRNLLSTKSTEYKYCVLRHNTKDGKYKFEHYEDGQTGLHNRTLYVDRHMVGKKGEWHQYDGMVLLKPKDNIVQRGIDYIRGTWRKEAERRAYEFAAAFIPHWFQPSFHLENLKENFQTSLEHLDMLITGLRKVYERDAKCWDNAEHYKYQMCENLFQPLIEQLTSEKYGSSSIGLLRALALSIACNRLQVGLSQNALQILCKCLMVTPDSKNRKYAEVDEISNFIGMGALKPALINVIKNVVMYGKDPSWMFCLPLLHFASKLCEPFEEMSKDMNHEEKRPKWWGIADIEAEVTTFQKNSYKWILPLEDVLQILGPLYEMDYYIPRSIVASLTVDEIVFVIDHEAIPVEVCCATLLHWMKATNPDNNRYSTYNYLYDESPGGEQLVTQCLVKLLKRLQTIKDFAQSHRQQTSFEMAYCIAKQLVDCAAFTNRIQKLMYSVRIFLQCVSSYSKLETKGSKKENDIKNAIDAVGNKVLNWLRTYANSFSSTDMLKSIKVWESAITGKLSNDDLAVNWNERITRALQQRIESEMSLYSYRKKDFIRIYCSEVETFNTTMKGCLTHLALKAIDGGYTIDYKYLSSTEKERFRDLLSGLFLRQWQTDVTNGSEELQDMNIFKMAICWPPIQLFVRNQNEEGVSGSLLTDDCKNNLQVATALVQSRWDTLETGNIEIGILQMISEHSEGFSETLSLIRPKEKGLKEKVLSTIKIRMIELKAFRTQSRQMTVFVNLCHHLKSVDTRAIDEVLQKTSQLEKHSLIEVCKPIVVEDTGGTLEPHLRAFDVEQDILDILPRLEQLTEGHVFIKIWNDTCSGTTERCDTPLDVVNVIWNPAYERWNNFCKQLKTGELMFVDAERMFGIFKDDDERILQEIVELDITRETGYERIKQIKQNRQLSACVAGARVILKFQKQYRLQGDFQAIKTIVSHSERSFKLKDFDKALMKTCEILKDITERKSHCLDAFVKSDKLVKWLKESMQTSGQKELKVFVDLAMMSAGEEPLNIAKVQCLHSAVLGYSPLIFDLDETDCNYKQLLEMCKVVWKELAANPNLPKQLLDTSRELEWLKEIKKAHGSVEVTSLMQAEAINADGIYTVGKGAWKGSEMSDMMVKDLIKLTVPGKDGQRQQKHYTFDQLQDLQSRLMLVAGKSDSSTAKSTDKKSEVNVDRFTMIFDSVTRLGSVYLKLCSSGCVLFNGWNANFLCSLAQQRPVCAKLEFGKGEDIPELKGRKSDVEGLEDMVPKIADFMENCYGEWLDFIKQKRKIYRYLNFFTIDQLVILQRELVKMGTEEEPSLRIYHLLSAVKENCMQEDVVLAMEKAKRELSVMEDGPDETSVEIHDQEEIGDQTEEKISQFIHELVEAGYDEEVARKSVDHVKQEDIDDCDVTEALIWCMDQKGEENDGVEMNQDDDEYTEDVGPRFSGWSNSTTSISSLIKRSVTSVEHKANIGVKPLINDLKELWKNFLGSISSNISDYLSLEHLGVILNMLAERDERNIRRNMPPVYVEEEPNLVVCPSDEVLRVALSIYMYDPDQPLPQSDEVLVCTSETSADEVSIFWRRAIYDRSGKIHCLLHADQLDFDVSEAAEQCLEELLLDIRHSDGIKYRLFVICGSDNEYRSTIVSSLEKCLRHVGPVNGRQLKEYVTRHLEAPAVPGKPCAAMVDFKRSTVRIIKSTRAGVGKTLFVHRKDEAVQVQIQRKNKSVDTQKVSIPLQEKVINLHCFIQRLLEHTPDPRKQSAKIFHLNMNHEVQEGVDYVLFNLLILNCLVDKSGYVWRRSVHDLYLIEAMPIMTQATDAKEEPRFIHPVFTLFPDSTCRSPDESLQIYSDRNSVQDFMPTDQLFDEQQFRSPVFQRTFQYLLRLDQRKSLESVKPSEPEGDPKTCLNVLLKHCGVRDPSWSELHHFVWFLNTQLVDFEQNQFVSVAAAEDLPGFATFVLRFLIQMSRDFSTRSLNMSEETPGMNIQDAMDTEDEDQLQLYQMRRTWESSPHPYLFFNSDRFTFTFLGFYIDRNTGNLVDQQTNRILEQGIMAQNLYDSLVRNQAPIREDFDALPRDQKIMKLCSIMGVEFPHDPDSTYELTTDNVKKIMAIYMRFRCDIPVIIMGETGCGKTRLIKFMCELQSPPGVDVKNMILMKVHGGTTNEDIKRKVNEAENAARVNIEKYGRHMYTVMFFDEANTTEAIGLIKEIMCDKSIAGKRLALCENLKIVAACNPYRKHSDELIKKLEQAGLGYHVDADETTDRLGRVPMRRLVYRVQPLPQSLLPLVWDFGQLNTNVEELYIRQMVRRYINDDKLPAIPNLIEVVSRILTVSQDYMRAQRDECSFVSLRDVERVLTVMAWFYYQGEDGGWLFEAMDRKVSGSEEHRQGDSDEEEETEDERYLSQELDNITRSLILAIGVCYHACLKTRQKYRQAVAGHFRQPCSLQGGEAQILEEIERCQEVFLDNVSLEDNIARNTALKENVFMMVVCIELRIPLFLVGKPGSSKSLAKTIVSDAMQGNSAKHDLFRLLKQVQMVSFQCSPLSTPDGIVGTFRQCAQFQKDKDLQTFVSAVVLDEVGLAEDSPRMPLKTLHPLLEDGCQGDEKPEPFMKVAFIGISNWALDPAKMNRGILVQREVPDLEELQNSARGICGSSKDLGNLMDSLIEPLSISYLEVFAQATQKMREFFGLRDFYSLVKMVYSFVEKSNQPPTWYEMLHAIRRNFGGLDEVNPEEIFRRHLARVISCSTEIHRARDPDCSPDGLIRACLFDTHKTRSESRYMLLLTENFGALSIIQQLLQTKGDEIRPITIFGSSFRSDQEYTQVCRNINKIKVCMETGNTVVLLNLDNLYESLYDALNQYYVYFGGERYVDLGLGTHRVKCPVHKKFRLIVVAEKQTVYKKFPIPLINRLEKHFLTVNTILKDREQQLVLQLEKWASDFACQNDGNSFTQRNTKRKMKVGDVFIGFHKDTCSAIIMDVSQKYPDKQERKLLEAGKLLLLWCATPESVVRQNKLDEHQQKRFQNYYHERQAHSSLISYLQMKLKKDNSEHIFAQVTTHSKLLASVHKQDISLELGIDVDRIILLETLSSFDTEQQFTNRVQQHLQTAGTGESLMLVQCDSGDVHANLIACARYIVMDEYEKAREYLRAPVHAIFIVQLPRKAGGCFTGFQCGRWHSAHIDDLCPESTQMPDIQDLQGKTVSGIFHSVVRKHSPPSDIEAELREEMDWTENGANGTQQIDIYTRTNDGANEGVDVMDIDVEFNRPIVAVNKDVADHQRQAVLKLDGLIMQCVQSALAMVKDKEDYTQRETQRVDIVLKCLRHDIRSEQGIDTFLTGLQRLIGQLLKEKEEKTGGDYIAQLWMTREAAAAENINKAGTFRRSCLQTIISKVSPILAGIIAYLDTNRNLDLIHSDVGWKQMLWTSVLNTEGAIQLQFSDLQSPKRCSDLGEMLVMTTGREGHMFSACVPFSWTMIQMIADILHDILPSDEEFEDEPSRIEHEQNRTIAFCAKIVAARPMGMILNQLVDGIQEGSVEQKHATVFEIVEEYIQDFVHTMYYPRREDEFKLVCQTVHYKTMEICEATNSMGCLIEILTIVHVAYDILALRLAYFRSMNGVWPQCSSVILEVKKTNPDHFMFKEREFTFSALRLLIENLNPKPQELNEEVQRGKWLHKVHLYRPVIEKVLNLHSEDPALYGSHSELSVLRAKSNWGRVIVMKLFIEHVCKKDGREAITIKYCMPLWKILGEEVDMKEQKSLEGVEKFLKSCNQNALKTFNGAEIKCCSCEQKLEGPPVTLPCKNKDVLCDACLGEMKALDQYVCPKCHENLGQEWQPLQMEGNSKEREQLIQYQKRCNAFFMDVVAQLCFSDGQPPSKNVLKKLLGYVTCSARDSQLRFTKNMTIFETGLDPNPVFRSFLLQLMLKSSEEEFVKESLKGYIEQAQSFFREEPTLQQNLVDLSLLIVQCLEDTMLQQWHGQHMHNWSFIIHLLETAGDNLVDNQLTIEKLYCIARLRVGLSQAVRVIADIVNGVTLVQTLTNEDEEHTVIESAKQLCTASQLKWPKIFLVKHLCRCYGIDVYQSICRHRTTLLRWIVIEELERDQTQEVSDRYVVCGNGYVEIREALSQVMLGEDISILEEKVQELHTTGGRVDTYLQLAVHREITCSYVRPIEKRTATPKSLQMIATFLESTQSQQNKPILRLMMNNTLEPRDFMIAQGSDTRRQGVQCLIIHFMTVLSPLNGARTILHLFLAMIQGDPAIRGMFLPTMPQDDFTEIQEAMLANRGGENPVFYRCPNGHPYVIGNCGRPYQVAKCKDCGADIGGQGHQALPGNAIHAGGDNTIRGHILGRAVPNAPLRPERELSALHCCVIRLLLHMSMFIGPPQQMVPIVRPDVAEDNIRHFFWEHIETSIGDLQRALGRSVDDVLLLMHCVIQNIMVKHNGETTVGGEIAHLQTKRGRQAWEKQFATVFLQDVFQGLDNQLKHFNQVIANDQRLGSNPLMCILYETDNQQQAEDPQRLEKIPRVWRYRTPISIEHMRQDLETRSTSGKDRLSVLRLFLKQDHILQAIQYIPSILSLQRILLQKFQKKLDKAEANTILVKDMIKDQHAGPDTEKWLQDFAQAWNITRKLLELYVCTTEFGSIVIPKHQCVEPVSMETPLSVFLPSSTETGLCSYAMLDLLFRKQNEFLDSYMKESGRKRNSIQTVAPMEATSAHLISYNHEQDILPLVLANCQYTFEMGKGTKIEYDFAGLERQIMDRFLFSKSRIDIGYYLQIDQMVYRTEFTNAAVFEKLEEKIPQQTLGLAVKTQISEEIKRLPDLCRFLDNLDIAISFLKTAGGQQSDNLNTFMVDTLQMEHAMTSQKARQSCDFQHAKSLWLLLSYLKSKFMVEHFTSKQEVFETLLEPYHDELSDELQKSFGGYMKTLSIDKLSGILEILHEFMLLRIARRENTSDEDYIDNTENRLGEELLAFVELMETQCLDTAVLLEFPQEIHFKHSVCTWIMGYTTLRKKMGRRRH